MKVTPRCANSRGRGRTYEEFDMIESTCGNPECANAPAPKPRSGPQSPYCSRACRHRASYLRRRDAINAASRAKTKECLVAKACKTCGQEFTPKKTNRQVHCTPKCSSRSNRDSSVTVCSAADCERNVRAKGLCLKHYKAQHPNRKTWKKNGDPEVRRANLRRKTQQRRARTKGDANAELIERSEIGDRDGWRCGICSRHVDQSLEYPHPRSPSLDHIHPLSLGGTHVRANVQIAHLECNVHKSNRVADVQPLLVG